MNSPAVKASFERLRASLISLDFSLPNMMELLTEYIRNGQGELAAAIMDNIAAFSTERGETETTYAEITAEAMRRTFCSPEFAATPAQAESLMNTLSDGMELFASMNDTQQALAFAEVAPSPHAH